MKILCVLGRHNYGDPSRGDGYEYFNFIPAIKNLGHEVEIFESLDRRSYCDFADMNAAFVRTVDNYRPDLIFMVLMHYEIWTETLDLIRTKSPAILVNWGTDDSWKYDQFSRFIVPHVDLHATTDRTAYDIAHHCGRKNVLYSQWAANSELLSNVLPAKECRYDVTFVGTAYGNRRRWIDTLAARGITVRCFGHGWQEGSVRATDVLRIYRESRISLGFSDSGMQLRGIKIARSRQIKARTFEVPGAGGFLLVEPSNELGRYLEIGKEIETFENPNDLSEKIRYYLNNPTERDRVARAGNKRVRQEHTYESRFADILEIAKNSDHVRRKQNWVLDLTDLTTIIAQHRAGLALQILRKVLSGVSSLIWGSKRGPRAARRLLFELSWRICKERTYSVKGWPGRLFYRES